MAQPSETPKEMLSILEDIVKDSPSQEEMRKRIIQQVMGGISREDAQRIVYGKFKGANP